MIQTNATNPLAQGAAAAPLPDRNARIDRPASPPSPAFARGVRRIATLADRLESATAAYEVAAREKGHDHDCPEDRGGKIGACPLCTLWAAADRAVEDARRELALALLDAAGFDPRNYQDDRRDGAYKHRPLSTTRLPDGRTVVLQWSDDFCLGSPIGSHVLIVSAPPKSPADPAVVVATYPDWHIVSEVRFVCRSGRPEDIAPVQRLADCLAGDPTRRPAG